VEVVAVLKGLLEDGEMTLGDGRRCTRRRKPLAKNDILIHENFRVIALANPPSFPFLGNNVYSRIGDCFSTHIISNSDKNSELELLQSYAPDVDGFVLEKLADLFAELRQMTDSGTLQHPYSLRELVQVVKHLQKFPENLSLILRNVFALDFNNAIVAPILRDALLRHGIPDVDFRGKAKIGLAKWRSFAHLEQLVTWQLLLPEEVVPEVPEAIRCIPALRLRPWKWRPEHTSLLRGRSMARIQTFSESVFSFSLPPKSVAADCAQTRDGKVYLFLSSPVQICSYDSNFSNFEVFDLATHLPYHSGSFPGRPQMFEMTDSLGVNLLILFLPIYRILIVIDIAGAFATPVQIPLDDSGSSHFGEKLFPDAGSLRGNAKQVVACANDRSVASWAVGGSKICFTNLTSPNWSHQLIQIPFFFEIDRVMFVKDSIWLIQGIAPRDVLLFDLSSRAFTRVVTSVARELISANCSLVFSAKSDLISVADETLTRHACYPHASGKDWTVGSLTLRSSGNGLIQTNSGKLLLVDPSKRAVRPLCGEEDSEETTVPIACFCELQNGRVLVVRENGVASVYDADETVLAREQLRWRLVAGLPPESGEEEEGEGKNESSDDLTLKVNGQTVARGQGKGKGEGKGSGGGKGSGSGGGEGSGSGGVSGVKREGSGGPREAEGLLDKQIDELQRVMARKGLEEELALIDMGKFDLQEYRAIAASVAAETEQLRNVLLALEARGKERTWLKGKANGEMDDSKLVETIVGDSNVFKRRGMQQPRAFGPQEKPKRLLFCVDLSASMYRFNTQDQRLARLQALCVMIMEALSGDELSRKYHYSIVGHSGDDCAIPLGADFGAPPPTAKERYALVKKMVAHSEYCSSGDNSLEGLKHAVKSVSAAEADDYFVLLVSDANLSRYGIDPAEFGAELTRCATSATPVNAFALFIASFDGEAEAMRRSLPLGKAFVTFDTAELPKVFQQIFSSTSFMRTLE
jgi:hypothetical protein